MNETNVILNYRERNRCLLYLSCKTHPDLNFAVHYESHSIENSKKKDYENLKRTLRYLKGTVSTGIFHRNNPDKNGDKEVLHFVHGSMEVGVSSFVPVIIYRSVSKYVVELKFFFH